MMTKPKRPNIIIVCTDQQRTDTLSCYGSTFLNTPGFDQIAKDGIRFDRAYCTSAVCTPSRVSLLSGQYVSRHNVWNIGVNTGDDVTMIQHVLRDHGYNTGLIGKAHLEAYLAPPEQSQESIAGYETGYGDWDGPYYGFDHVRLALGHVNYGMTGHYGAWLRQHFTEDEIAAFKVLEPVANGPEFGGEAYRSNLPVKFHNSVWTVDSAVEFLDAQTDDPFFLFVSFQDPHHPHAIPKDFEPTVLPEDAPEPHFTDGELDDKPPHFALARTGDLSASRFIGDDYKMSGQGDGFDYRNVGDDAALNGRATYYSMVGLIDQQLCRLWAELKARNLYDDTLIIVTSDHGELLGDHGLWMKGPYHYDEVVRVPLIMKPPKGHHMPKGQGSHALASLVDLMPTCLAAAGASTDDLMLDGSDLTNVDRDNPKSVLIETTQDWHSLICKTVISQRHKLTWYSGEDFGELYDLDADPGELTNLWNCPDHQSIKAVLISEILRRHVDVGKSAKGRISYA